MAKRLRKAVHDNGCTLALHTEGLHIFSCSTVYGNRNIMICEGGMVVRRIRIV